MDEKRRNEATQSSLAKADINSDLQAEIERVDLPWQHIEIVRALHTREGLTIGDISTVLKCSQQQVKESLARAGVTLRWLDSADNSEAKVEVEETA